MLPVYLNLFSRHGLNATQNQFLVEYSLFEFLVFLTLGLLFKQG